MKKLTYWQGTVILLALCACGWYLCLFFGRVLLFYGVTSSLLFIAAMLVCLAVGLIEPIPLKLRTVCCMYIGFYGIVIDIVLLLFAPAMVSEPRSGLVELFLTVISVWYGYYHGRQTVQKHYVIPSLLQHPVRIALLSDIHMGYTVDKQRLQETLQRIERELPDLLIVAGDLCDDKTSLADMELAARLLGEVSCDVYTVPGNHDLGAMGRAMHYAEDDYRAALAENGVRLLDDETADLGAFVLLGRRDRWMDGRTEAAALPSLTKPCIVIDHQPFSYKENASLGAFLQLSGHTHGAQVFPLSLLGRLLPGFYGLRRHKNLTLITSCGLGNRGSKLRSGCTAEYVIIDLAPNKEV